MKQYKSEHYIFNYHSESKAEKDIKSIATIQEACYKYICDILGVTLDFKIQYFLCNSPEEVGRMYGDNEPCNGFASIPDKIYAVYNEEIQCIGFHEDVHIISYTITKPDSPAIREGLAMYFDRKWWGIHNIDWTAYYIKTDRYISINELLNKDKFFLEDCSITYPIMGSFTEWLINSYGIKKYLSMYKQRDMNIAINNIYKMTVLEMEQSFKDYILLFKVDKSIENRMFELLSEYENKI